jgi:DNA-binding XRE family transcriptional regulator
MPRTNLKVFRVKKHLTQTEMAEKIGYLRQTYAAIENGKRDGRQAFWCDLQKAFNLSDGDVWALMKNDEK